MYFRISTVLTLLLAPFIALAQNPNPFNIPQGGIAATGGKPLALKWNPTTSGTITLILRSGSSNDLDKGTVIASNLQNSGSYTWTPSNSLTSGTDYAIEIVDDDDQSLTNYTPPFTLTTDMTTSKSTSWVTMGAPSTSIAKQTAKVTTKETTSANPASSSPTTSGETSTTPNLASSTGGLTAVTTGGTTSPTGASFQGTSANAATGGSPSESSSQGSGARATAMAGMLGVVALGALAL